MKLEKINDNQIRCTLNRSDLLERHLNVKELSYGTDKAKNLFREMLTKASYELDFDTEDIPLMVEAIPLSEDSIMLLITKVEDPEELDTRFAKFSPENMSADDDYDDDYDDLEIDITPAHSYQKSMFSRADEILNAFSHSSSSSEGKTSADNEILIDNMEGNGSDEKPKKQDSDSGYLFYYIYRFPTLDDVAAAARVLSGEYHGNNSLYKDTQNNCYSLILHKSDHTPEEFNRICNMLSEYGDKQKHIYAAEAYYKEHVECLIEDKALQVMKDL